MPRFSRIDTSNGINLNVVFWSRIAYFIIQKYMIELFGNEKLATETQTSYSNLPSILIRYSREVTL